MNQHPAGSGAPLPATLALCDQAEARVRDVLDLHAFDLSDRRTYNAVFCVLRTIQEAALIGPSYNSSNRMLATVHAWLGALHDAIGDA